MKNERMPRLALPRVIFLRLLCFWPILLPGSRIVYAGSPGKSLTEQLLPPRPPTEAQHTPAEGRTFAIIIGISDYAQLPKLQFADKDALEFYLYLQKTAPSDAKRIFIFLNKSATRDNIAEKFYQVVDNARAGDKVFIYFSGHGDIEQLYTTNNFFLLMGKCPTKNYMASSNSFLDKGFFDYYIQALIAKNVKTIFICDACHAGSLIGGAGGKINNNEGIMQSWKDEVKLVSCRPDQSSQEGTKWGGGRSVFSYFLVLGMQGLADKDGDQQISVSELQDYLEDHVVEAAKSFNLDQEPEIAGAKSFVISKTSPSLLSEAQQQLRDNTSSGEYNKLATAKGARIEVGNNSYVFKSEGPAQYGDQYLEMASDNSITDPYWRSVGYAFNDKLDAGNLLEPGDNSAYYYYQSFAAANKEAPETQDMRTRLRTALLETYDTLLDHYYAEDTVGFQRGAGSYDRKILETALSLAGDQPPIAGPIKAKLLFLDACRSGADTAIALLQTAARADSLNPAVYGKLGDLYFSADQFQQAADSYLLYTQLLPNEEYAHDRLGLALLALGQKDRAAAEFKAALQIDPSFQSASLHLAQSKK